MTESSGHLVSNFDVLKKMSADNLDIRIAPIGNVLNMKAVKAGTQITIGVQGNMIGAILSGELIGCLMLYDKKQFDETKALLSEEIK